MYTILSYDNMSYFFDLFIILHRAGFELSIVFPSADYWLFKFKEHLQSRLGTHKTWRVAAQHARQVEITIGCLGDLDQLLDLEGAGKWLDCQLSEKNLKPGTLDSYCHSVALFFDFLLSSKQRKVFSQYLNLHSLQQFAKDWRRLAASLQKDKQRQAVARKEMGYCKWNLYIEFGLGNVRDSWNILCDTSCFDDLGIILTI